MTTGAQLADEVLRLLQEPSVTEQDALGLLSRGAEAVSGTVLLPELEAEAVVQTVPGYGRALLPPDYQRNLFMATDSQGRGLVIWNGRDQLMRYTSSAGVSVCAVCATPPHLLYLPVLSGPEDLTIHYHRRPDAIASDSEVSFLPADFARLLVHFACWQGFAMIEQGLEGQKIDTNYHKAEFMGGVESLRLYLREGVSMPAPPQARCVW